MTPAKAFAFAESHFPCDAPMATIDCAAKALLEAVNPIEAELAALREYMAQHAPLQLRSFGIRDAQPENPERWE